jgi:hypothetical protein
MEITVRLNNDQVQELNDCICEAPELFDKFFDIIEVDGFILSNIEYDGFGGYYYRMEWNT